MQKEERLVERATLAWIARTWDATVAQGMDDFPNLVVENFRLEDEVRRILGVRGDGDLRRALLVFLLEETGTDELSRDDPDAIEPPGLACL